MTARKKSRRSRSTADFSNILQLIFQMIVIGAIGWFVYSGYSKKETAATTSKVKTLQVKPLSPVETPVARPRETPVVAAKPVAAVRPVQYAVVEDEDFESDEVLEQINRARARAASLKEEIARERSGAGEYPEIAMTPPPPRPRKTVSSRKPKIVFVIDDMGHTNEFQSLVFALGSDVTYAILPDLEYSRYFDSISRRTGADVILHLPLETISGRYPGPGLITNKMSDAQVLQMLSHNFESAPHSIGANNHMGSLGSADRRLMRVILQEFKRRGKFFLDSYTTKDSVIISVGKELGLEIHRRDVFLDNTDEQPYIRKQIKQLADAAYKNGIAVGIGHYRYNTLKVLSEEIPRLKDSGYEIIRLSEIY